MTIVVEASSTISQSENRVFRYFCHLTSAVNFIDLAKPSDLFAMRHEGSLNERGIVHSYMISDFS